MRAKIILNPHAGRGRVKQRVLRVQSALTRVGIEYDLITLCRRGQAREEAISASFENFDAVVAAGGDGTVHEVINGLILASAEGSTCSLGIMPLGTGNDFGDVAGIPRDLDAAVYVIAEGQERQVDAGLVNFSCKDTTSRGPASWHSCYFDNNCAVAMEPVVTMKARKTDHLSGNIRYIGALLRTLRDMQAWHMQISWDSGAYEGPMCLLSVANNPRTGGLFMVAPGARIDDGLFDFVIAPKLPMSLVLAILPRLVMGTHIHHPAITTGRTTQLHIRSRPGTPIHADGEIIAGSADIVDFRVLPGVISLLAP